MTRPPLAIFSPLPPSRSGIADYHAELLPHLARHFEIACVIDDRAPSPVAELEVEVVRASQWRAQTTRDQKTPRLYHLGNNPDHTFALQALWERPGVTVLHDFTLHHLLLGETVAKLDHESYQDLLAYDHGRLGRRLGAMLLRGVFTEYQQFVLPLNGTVLDSSLGMIVHSGASLRRIQSSRPDLPATRIPHHLGPQPAAALSANRASLREACGYATDEFVVTSLGFITPPKQIELCLKALVRMREELPPFRYVLVGEKNLSYDIDAQVRRYGLQDRVQITGYVSMDDFHRYVRASDAVVNLRYPSAGETSGTLVRALGLARPCVVFDFDSFADYPADTVMKIPLNTDDERPLAAAILQLARDAPLRDRIGRRAAEHVHQQHDLAANAERYAEFIHRVHDPGAVRTPPRQQRSRFTPQRKRPRIRQARELVERYILTPHKATPGDYFRVHAERFAQTLQRLPPACGPMSVLELGSYGVMLPVFRDVLGYRRVVGSDFDADRPVGRLDDRRLENGEPFEFYNFNVERDEFPFPARTFDLVLCCELIEHLTVDPMFMLAEINRVLKYSGILVVTTPNIASARSLAAMLRGGTPLLYPLYNQRRSSNRHNIEYAPRQLASLLEAAGFSPTHIETANCWSPRGMGLLAGLLPRSDLRGDCLLATAVKQTEVLERFPAEMYDH